jgi:transposase
MIPDDEIERARARAEAFPLISIQQVAKQYGVSLRTLRRWQAAGLMPEQIKHGRRKVYRRDKIAQMFFGHDGGGKDK